MRRQTPYVASQLAAGVMLSLVTLTLLLLTYEAAAWICGLR